METKRCVEQIKKNRFSIVPQLLGRRLTESETTITEILANMENGFKVDICKLGFLNIACNSKAIKILDETEKQLGRRIKINSNSQVGSILFSEIGLPIWRITPKGSASVSLSVLQKLSGSYSNVFPFLKSVIEYRNTQALIKSIKTVSKKLDLQGRIHPEFNSLTCPTGRIYSYIQNLLKGVRKVLIPDEERNVFIELDWSQQELRILAALSQEPVFLDCFARNEDLHRRVISEMFHKPVSEVTDEERKAGKTINYALIYGQEAPGLAWKLNIPLKKAQELIDQYFSSLPMIQKFKYESREKFLSTGYAETPLGRKTKLDLIGPNKERELRRGFNHLIQGIGADILRITLVRLNEALIGTQVKLKFCAHDSIYLEARKETFEEVAQLAKPIMEIDFMGVHLPIAIKTYHDFSMGEGNA